MAALTLSFLLFSVSLWSQNVGVCKQDIAIAVTSASNPVLQALPFAGVTICKAGALGLPCAPPVQVYSDPGLTTPLSIVTADAQGNYKFCAPQGNYMIQVSSAGLATFIQDNVTLPNDPVTAKFKTLDKGIFYASAYTSGSNTGGIQEAYAAANSAGGGVVQLPYGTTNCANTVPCLTICASNIEVRGYGRMNSILASKNADAIAFCNSVSGGLHDNYLHDFGTKLQAGSTSGKGIDIIETASAFENSHFTFERITITNMPEQGFHDGNCSWCSFKDLVMQGNSGRGMEVGTSSGGKGGSSNDSSFDNVEVSTNSFGGLLNWGRANTFKNGHYFNNTSKPDIEVRGSNNIFLGGWVEDCTNNPCVLIRRSDPTIYNNKFIGVLFTETVGNVTIVSVGQSGDGAGSVAGTWFQGCVFTSNDAPYPSAGANNAFIDINIDSSASFTRLIMTQWHLNSTQGLVNSGFGTIQETM